MEDCLIKKIDGFVCTLTMNNPEKRNALDSDLRARFAQVMDEIKFDDGIFVVILTGNGKTFCAGGDLSDMKKGIDLLKGREKISKIHDWYRDFVQLEKPVIGAVNGAAIGAGFSLALACDFIVASEKAIFGSTFGKVGLCPDYGSMYLLPRAVGWVKAKELVMTGDTISAAEMLGLHAIHSVTEPDLLMEAARKLAVKVGSLAPFPTGLSKRIMLRSYESTLEQIFEYEALSQALCYHSDDHREGVDSFFEKRPPVFAGK